MIQALIKKNYYFRSEHHLPNSTYCWCNDQYFVSLLFIQWWHMTPNLFVKFFSHIFNQHFSEFYFILFVFFSLSAKKQCEKCLGKVLFERKVFQKQFMCRFISRNMNYLHTFVLWNVVLYYTWSPPILTFIIFSLLFVSC